MSARTLLLLFGDEVIFSPPGTDFIIAETGENIVMEDGTTEMITE